ncbi:MAG: DNA internalization-related competence protein ComEC/Rec2 [Lachnospiraceae bacterium]|nr:DNA internalization-related competence protein ComEC/Rec2 [Lachnospiraceae bacterium]
MKRPFGCACLFFVLFIRLFYVCFPPKLPDYSTLKGREVYACGQVQGVKVQEINGELQTVYTISRTSLRESSAVSGYFSDKSISVQNTKEAEHIQYVHDKIYCYISHTDIQIHIGAWVWFYGSFMPFEAAENPGQFDSQLFYHVQGIGGSLREGRFIWSDDGKDILSDTLYHVKNYFAEKIDGYFTPLYGGVMKTILLGDKTDLDKELKQLFQEGGILHILTISGLHISMLGMGCFRLLRRLGVAHRPAAIIGLVIVIFYGMMIGTQAATFRAICMFVMQMAAVLLGRTYDRLTGLAIAAILLLLEEPMYVFYSGFLLSFGAVLGVTVFSPVVERWCKEKGVVAEYIGKWFSGGIGILLCTLPIQLYFYYEYPLYSILINVIVLPILPFIVGFGAVVLAVPGVISVAAVPFVTGCEWLLGAYRWICEWSQRLPCHSLVLGAPKAWQIVLYYGCLVGVFGITNKKLAGERLIKGMILSCFAVSVCCLFWRPVKGLTCRFLSVGQGDCAILQYGQETYIVDCGSTSKSNVGTQILLPCLKYYGVSKVNGVFLSHADGDHMNGIVQWLENYEHSHVELELLILPELAEEALQQEFGELLGLAEAAGVSVATLGAGDKLSLRAEGWPGFLSMREKKELGIEVLHPVKNCSDTEDANGYSQVLLFSYGGQGVLMTGDIGEKQEEELLLKVQGKNIVLLKAAHHGSKYSSTEAFLKNCSPKHVILSYGVGNSYGHPHKAAVARMEAVGARLWYTGRVGAVQCILTGDNLIMESFPFR